MALSTGAKDMLDLVNMPQSVGQNEKHDSRSEKYVHVPTSEVIDLLMSESFVPVKAYETKTRKADKQGFQKHMIRFRRDDMETIGDSVPEIVVINSHDGTTGLQLWSGMFRMICSNGIVAASETYAKVSLAHRGNLGGKIIEASYKVIEQSNKALLGVQEWSHIMMTDGERLGFAEAALHARYGNNVDDHPIDPRKLLTPRRLDDVGCDLWRVFNVVQENLIKGGLGSYKRLDTGRIGYRSVRAVRSVGRNVELNADLWQIAERHAMQA
jgi:hypothetical protein